MSKKILMIASLAIGAAQATKPCPYVEVFSLWSGADLKTVQEIAERDPQLLEPKIVNSVGFFNPYVYDFGTVEELEASELTDEQVFKWLRYRRHEIKVCFEDESYNAESGFCEVLEELIIK